MKANSNRNAFVDVSVLIVTATVVVYWCSYTYEKAIFRYYKLPDYLIDTTNGLLFYFSQVGLMTITLMVILFLLTFILIYGLNISKTDAYAKVTFLAFIDLFGVMLLYKIAEDYMSFAVCIGIFLLGNLTIIVGIFIINFKKLNFDDKIPYIDFQIKETNFFAYIFYLIVPITLWIFSGAAGLSEAKNQEEYLVTGRNQDIVIIQKNGDFLIGKPYSKKNNEFTDSVILYKISDQSPFIMEYKHIGKIEKR